MARDIKLGWDVESLNKAYRQGYMPPLWAWNAAAVPIAEKSLLPPGKQDGKTLDRLPMRRGRSTTCSPASPDACACRLLTRPLYYF